ncbi:MAG TPA: hypothetical protein VHT49_11305 [Acidimicrobiales bacterium]|jgi:hypothetical protein|nr:hypothetical protein [Acidimicrobiales bacterium]
MDDETTNPPKADRIGNDFHEGDNPNPGGDIDTGDSRVPPYEGRSKGTNERSAGPGRMLDGEDPPEAATQPESKAGPRPDAAEAPPNVGESVNRHGEDVVKQEGKEPGRTEEGETDGAANRPSGSSTSRDQSGV